MAYKFMREDAGTRRVLYRNDKNRIYCIQDDGGYGRQRLTFYRCSRDGEPAYALDSIPDPRDFDHYLEPL